MHGIHRLLRRSQQKESLRKRIKTSNLVLVTLMLIPALIAISLMMVFSSQYHGVIVHMEEVSSLQPLISSELLTEMIDIIAGRKRFEEGNQFTTLEIAAGRLDTLIDSNAASRMELEVARRLLSTLYGKVESMGVQMRQGSTVDEDFRLNEEINNVAALFLEMLQNSINAEIVAAAEASNRMQIVVQTTLLIEICLLLLTLLFVGFAQRSLSKAIRVPLEHLKQFAGRIASGELSERASPPDVEELQDLTHSLNTMAFKLQRLIDENTREQENLKKSELRALQAQITPHFLYNTLDAIIWLAESRRSGEVITITHALSNFFRTSLNNGKDWITIEQEIAHLEGYLTIQKIRYRDILQYEIHVEEALKSLQILKLLIQPLVENAIYHGIKNRRGGGKLIVNIQTQSDALLVKVWDSGIGMTSEQLMQIQEALRRSEPLDMESGYGLYSVDTRIKLYYNQSEGLCLESVPGEGASVSFRVPIRG